jgi:hypothetical protein
MGWFHPEEAATIGAVMKYADLNPNSRYRVEFTDGEGYICTYFTDYESENSGDLDIEMDDPRYDEFYQIWMTVLETLVPGHRGSEDTLTIDYRDFPASIVDAEDKSDYPLQDRHFRVSTPSYTDTPRKIWASGVLDPEFVFPNFRGLVDLEFFQRVCLNDAQQFRVVADLGDCDCAGRQLEDDPDVGDVPPRCVATSVLDDGLANDQHVDYPLARVEEVEPPDFFRFIEVRRPVVYVE